MQSQVQAQVQAFGEQIEASIERTNAWTTGNSSMDAASSLAWSDLTITTMTVALKLVDGSGPVRLDLAAVRASLDDARVLEVVALLDKPLVLRNSAGYSGFNNCLTFGIAGGTEDGRKDNNKAVKLFVNGSLHITGSTSLGFAVTLGEFFATLTGIALRGDHLAFQVGDFSIQMINANIQLRAAQAGRVVSVDLARMCQRIRDGTDHACRYDIERHAGMILKIQIAAARAVTAILFATGSLIITGARSGTELEQITVAVKVLVDANADLMSFDVAPSTRKRRRTQQEAVQDYGRFLLLS